MQTIFLVVNIIMALAAIIAIVIATRSLKETQRTRRDTFLPLVIPRGIGWTSTSKTQYGDFKIENIGRGPAWNVKIEYPNGEKKELAKFLHHAKNTYCNVNLPWPDFDKVGEEFILTMHYTDTFSRALRIRFRVTVEEDRDTKVLRYNQQDGFDFVFPT